MTLERFLLIALTTLSFATVFYIPKNKYRLALISFLAFQAITWAGSIILVELGYLEYPVRFFVRSTKAGFLHNFFYFPMVFTWYILLFPEKQPLIKKVFHFSFFVSIIIWSVYFIAVYTDLENFTKMPLHYHVLFLFVRQPIFLGICHIYISWFSKKTFLQEGG